jgi:Flp pilus assembly protein TadG
LKPSTLPAFALVAGLLWALGAPAQTATKPAAKPAAKAPAKASKAATKAAAAKVAAAEPVLARAEGEQLAAAALIHYGDYTCEFDQTVNVGVTPKHDGYVDVRHKAQTWTMKPVLSSTGALRLEDVKGRMLALQIANKSMLMDAQLGQRVLDGCVHEKQRAAIAAAAALPAGEPLLQGGAAASVPK